MSKAPGILPPGWVETTLNQVTLLRNEHVQPSTLQGKPYLSLEHIESGTNRIIDRGYSEDVKSIKSIFYSGDVLYGKLRPYLNKVCQPDFDGISSTDILAFAPSLVLDNTFLLKLLSRHETVEYANSHSKGINLPRVSSNQLGELRVWLPPFNEQKRIITRIEELQSRSRRAREALETLPELLEQLRQSLLAAAFSGDLTKEWRKKNPDVEPAPELLKRIRAERHKRWEEAELKHLKAKGLIGEKLDEEFFKRRRQYKEPPPVETTNLPELPESWCWTSWREAGFCQNGRAFPSKHYSSEGIKLLRPGNLHISGRIEWTTGNTRRMPEEWAEKYKDYIVGPGEVVLNLTAQSLKDEFLGRVCLTGTNERCLLNQRIARLTPIEISSEFCIWLFKSPIFRRYADTLNTGSLIQHMFTTQVNDFIFPLPPQEEQEMIVKHMNALIKKRESVLKSATLSTERLNGLDDCIMAKAFRGELVPQDPSDKPASVLLERIREEKYRIKPQRKRILKQKVEK